MNLPIDTETMLAGPASNGLGLILAHQCLSQLKAEVLDGVLTNARSKIALTLNANDAKTLLKAMPGNLTMTDLTNLRLRGHGLSNGTGRH